MNRCPICGKEFAFEDVLFFGTRNAMGSKSMKKPGVATRVDTQKSAGMTFAMSGGGFFGAPLTAKPQVEQKTEPEVVPEAEHKSDLCIAEWAEDAIHAKFMKDSGFWHGEDEASVGKKTERFIVHWSMEKCEKGIAKASIMAKNANVPTTVTLSDEDCAKYGKGSLLTDAMCPHCHCAIDPTYFSIPNQNCHIISLIGYPSCGKTEFKLALVEELSKLEDVFELCDSVELTVDSKKMTNSEGEAFKDGEAEATDPEKLVFPVVFMVKNKEDDSMHLISLCDMPGEFYRDYLDGMKEKLAANESLKKCDAAIMMIGASQLFPIVEHDRKTVRVENTQTGESKDVLVDVQYVPKENGKTPYITDPMKNFDKYEVCKEVKYLALVVTKGDLLIGKVGRGIADRGGNDPLLRQMKICKSDESSDHKSQVNVHVINQVDIETMRSIRKSATYVNKNAIKDEICKKVKGELKPENIRAFVISTLRRPNPEKAEFYVMDNSAYPRHRILEPLLFLLAEWGAVPKTNVPWGAGDNGNSSVEEIEAADGKDGEQKKEKRGGWLFWRKNRG